MRRAVLAFASLAVLSACTPAQEGNEAAANSAAATNGSEAADGNGISNASVRLPAVPGRPGAAYFTIQNKGAARVLVSASADKAERAEIHESKMEGGVMRMEKLDSLSLAANATATLAPGGKHIMLFGLDPALKAGDIVALDLTFEDGTSMRVEAKTQTVGGDVSHSGH
jgi:copper(I)-binding protein